jgi:hypothetical protein
MYNPKPYLTLQSSLPERVSATTDDNEHLKYSCLVDRLVQEGIFR